MAAEDMVGKATLSEILFQKCRRNRQGHCRGGCQARSCRLHRSRGKYATVIILTNEDVEPLLDMQTCIAAIEAAFRDLGNEDAVDIPRQDAVVPNATREAAIYGLKTMSGSWPGAGIAAVRINSDIITCPVVNGEARRVKVPISKPGGRYNGSVLLFSTETGQLLCMVNDGMMQKTRSGPPAASPRNISCVPTPRSSPARHRPAGERPDRGHVHGAAVRRDPGVQPDGGEPDKFRRAVPRQAAGQYPRRRHP